jgi:hypothetical protein
MSLNHTDNLCYIGLHLGSLPELCILWFLTNALHWWLTPVIITTQEAEIRRVEIGGQPR